MSDVTMVKSIDMFWKHFVRTFTEENQTSELLDASKIEHIQFGKLATVGDFNGDGVDDVTTIYQDSDNNAYLVIYYGRVGADVNFSQPQIIDPRKISTLNSTRSIASLAAVDVNHDGFDDLISVHYDTKTYDYPITFWFGNANGLSTEVKHLGFQYEVSMYGQSFKTGFLNVTSVEDVNGDGYSDLAIVEAVSPIWSDPLSMPPSNIFIVPTGKAFADALHASTSSTNSPITASDVALWQINSGDNESLGNEHYKGLWNIAAIQDQEGVGLIIGDPRSRATHYFSHSRLSEHCTVPSSSQSSSSPTAPVGTEDSSGTEGSDGSNNHGCTTDKATQTIRPHETDHSNNTFGYSIALLDGNADGVTDLYFGMPDNRSTQTNQQANLVGVASGEWGEDEYLLFPEYISPFVSSTISTVSLNGEDKSPLSINYFGTNIRPVNLLGDGLKALIVSTNSTANNRSFIYWSKSLIGLSSEFGSILEGPSTFGTVTETGDFNGDGRQDLLLTAPSCPNCEGTGDKNGEIHVYY